MVGTMISNFWIALFAFSIYFFSTYPFIDAKNILIHASIIAIVAFLFTFLARAIIAFVMDGPVVVNQEALEVLDTDKSDQTPNSEEYAKIVKSMLNEEE